MKKTIVFGAQRSSLGEAISQSLTWTEVFTAGISGDEHYHCDVTIETDIEQMFQKHGPFDNVVYTSGVNIPTDPPSGDFLREIRYEMDVNYTGAMRVLHHWLVALTLSSSPPTSKQFVAISSNSAHIARTPSLGYCASKAALSMGIRTAARWVSKNMTMHPLIWGVEPGWIEDTPMSKQMDGFEQPHRIPDGIGVNKWLLSSYIAEALMNPERAALYHGQMIRLDGGEQ